VASGNFSMTDVFDRATRSRIMRTVRIAETEPEDRLAQALRQCGLRFRKNDRRVFGCPDICFRGYRLAVFVDGDFWHGRAWFERREAPATNPDFWISKFEVNHRRDRTVDRALRKSGWSVLRLWGSEIRKAPQKAAAKVRARLRRLARERRPSRCVSGSRGFAQAARRSD
jgi:DNA mismatch endonuclease, patch repair protein